MVLLLAVAIGGALLMGFSGFMGVGGVSALAAAAGAAPLAPAMDDCAEAGAVHSREQNNAGKMILMRKSNTIQFRGAGALGLSWALAGNFVRQQKCMRRIAHRVPQALNEYRRRRGRG